MREWLETNGRGGYALGCESGGATRRYHGLLTAAIKPPLSRFQLVNRLEETVRTPGGSVSLSRQSYPGVPAAVAPELSSFRINTFPTWTFSVGDSEIEKTFFLRYGEDTAVVTYRLRAGPPVEMDIRPLLSFRDHHAVGRQDDRFEGRWTTDSRGFGVNTTAPRPLSVWATAGGFFQDPHWYARQRYDEEERRGLECEEDVWGPGTFLFSLAAGSGVSVVFSTVHGPDTAVDRWEEEEREQRHRVARASLARGPLGNTLTMAADSFIVSRGSGASVIAGYPWFGDWSRDALVSFPGLFLATGRWREAPGLLDTFARHARQGLLPNFFPEGAASVAYNAVDAPLWFVRAVQAYHRVTHDDAAVRRWLPVMRDMVDAFQNGAGYNIHMDGDGLIVAPAADVALTWMDARVDGRPVTPRAGKPVEIQALWYNALQFLVEIQLKLKEPTRGYDKLAEIARRTFNEKFWNDSAGYLFDVIDGKHRDDSIRPNALLAIGLPYEILEESRFLSVVDRAARDLLTPRGLRTLAPGHPAYRGRCDGPLSQRDRAYHQGTVWPWLLGPFVTAYVKAHGPTEQTKTHVRAIVEPLRTHLDAEGALGQVSEIFDGDAPHAPRGCPAQAWSVGELLRVIWEEGITL
ncbi:MAG: glycogen debranching enzyme family protein [Elusimicrobia bacterium]|nr:glycogen debranching enzyme family protein [Elusimicrobiota bacterium]